jgi:hypothetical protein
MQTPVKKRIVRLGEEIAQISQANRLHMQRSKRIPICLRNHVSGFFRITNQVKELLLIHARNTARSQSAQGGKKWGAQQQRYFTEEVAFIGIETRKIRWPPVNIDSQSQLPLEDHEETGWLTFPYKPFAWFEPHIRNGVRQSSAFGFVKTGKDFGLPQFFWSEHVLAS